MTDLAELTPGYAPWKPSPASQEGVLFHRYDTPLVGTFEQHGVTYLYTCLHGASSPVQVWTYRRIDAGDVPGLLAQPPDKLRAALLFIGTHGLLQVAVSIEEIGLMFDTQVEEAEGPEQVVKAALPELADRVRAWAESLLDELPGARSVTSLPVRTWDEGTDDDTDPESVHAVAAC